jgi:long-chain acyl-CoA synthetase
MGFDTDLHRHTIKLPGRLAGGKPLEMSVVEAWPADVERHEAPAMVFIHGFGGRAAYWEHQLEQFHGDYRVIALDLRGHGYTDAPTAEQGARYDVPELVGDIEAALEVLRVPRQFTLVCHSFGGALSSFFIQRNAGRVSALVIIASASEFRLRATGRWLLRVPPFLLSLLRKVLPYVGMDIARVYPAAHVVYLQNKNALSTWNGAEYLRRITVPTMVILGQRDILFSQSSYLEVAQLVPGAEEVIIPVSAHQVMVERPDAVNRAIERFLHAQIDPALLAEMKAARKERRRAMRRALEAERPWLKAYDARTPYRIRMPTVSLPRLLETTARRFAGTIAIHYLGTRMTWAELDRLSSRFARGLAGIGVAPRQRVVLALPNVPQWLIAYYGILKAGAVAVLADADTAAGELRARLQQTSASLLIADENRRTELQQCLADTARVQACQLVLARAEEYMGLRERFKCRLRRTGGAKGPARNAESRPGSAVRVLRFSQLLSRATGTAVEPATPDDVAVIVYTHGGAGRPVPLSHRNLASNALQLRHWLPESRPGDERFLALQPLSTVYGLTGLAHLGVYLGASLILLPEDTGLLLKTIRNMRPTYFPTTPRVIHRLTHTPGIRRFGLASIRVCAVSGSFLPQEVREEFEKITRGRLIEAYGLTEASPAVLAMPLAARRRATGLPLPDTEVRIVDLEHGAAAGIDVLGELQVRGPQVFAGYLDDDATVLRDGWLATGDVASMDEDGYVTVLDRRENMLMRAGERVFPRQLEEVLYEHPAVAMAQAWREPAAEGPDALRARILLHRNIRVTIEEMLQYCSKRLHAAALPDSITIDQSDPAAPT